MHVGGANNYGYMSKSKDSHWCGVSITVSNNKSKDSHWCGVSEFQITKVKIPAGVVFL